jgi:hypothetical protein
MPFSTLAVPFDQYAALPSAQHRWVLMALARYADRDGRCWPSIRQLARDARMSAASVCRYLKSLCDLGVFQRSRAPGMRYRYRLAEAYVPRWPGRVSSAANRVSQGGKQEPNQGKHRKDSSTLKEALKKVTSEEIHDDSLRWEARLRAWQRSRFWLNWWGPKPDQPDCWAPAIQAPQ